MSTRDPHPTPSVEPQNGAKDEPQYASSAPLLVFLRRHIWTVGLVFGVVMITALRNPLMRRPEAPEAVAHVVDAQLVDHNGASFSASSMQGKVWVVGFLFTRCPTTCPRVAQSMVELQRDLEASKIADRVSLLTVTVDPKFDSPEVLRGYAEKIGADTGNWSFVTGSKAEITRFVVDGFKTAMGDRREISPGVFDIAHSTKLAIVDAEGGIRGYYSADVGWDEDRHRLYHALFPVIRLQSQD